MASKEKNYSLHYKVKHQKSIQQKKKLNKMINQEWIWSKSNDAIEQKKSKKGWRSL